MWCLATLFTYVGFSTFTSYVASTAVSKGFPESFSFALVAIMNGSSGIGRVLAGLVASYSGSVNHMIPSTILAAVVILVWPVAMTQSSLVAISALHGLFAASYAALFYNPILDLGEPEELSRRVGILMLFLAFAGLVSPPISGAVEHAAGMRAMSIFAAGCTLVGVMLACTTRYMLLKNLIGKV
ncbi:hypothetical protein PM082_019316 [Marasmius tenuissimus]|nr:hypothetical protein PM082_019316 [Marasmius tenuissimus]